MKKSIGRVEKTDYLRYQSILLKMDILGFEGVRRYIWERLTDEEKKIYLDKELFEDIELFKPYFDDESQTMYFYGIYNIKCYTFDSTYEYLYAKYHVRLYVKYVDNITDTIGNTLKNLRVKYQTK